MARCGSQCPYHWHDEDCEYCRARGNEVIDLKDYSYDTCPVYQEYAAERRASREAEKAKRAAQEPEGSGCASSLLLIVVIVGILMFCTRSCGSSTRSVPSDDAQHTETSAVETSEIDSSSQDGGFIFPNSDSELIGQGEIEALSDSELTYAINEIYARHGYIFKSAELRGYYEQFSWYAGEVPASEFSVDCFNQIEQQNWNLLVKERNSRRASD